MAFAWVALTMPDARDIVAELLTTLDPEHYDPSWCGAQQEAAVRRVILTLQTRVGPYMTLSSSPNVLEGEEHA